MMLLKIAWMNIWRNPRRTIILLCAVAAGLAGVVFTMGFMNSWMDSMLNTAVQTYAGHVKILGRNYHDNPIVENCMEPPRSALEWLDHDSRIQAWTERVAAHGLVSSARYSTTVRIVGINPEKEKHVSIIAEAICEGKYLTSGEPNRILVGRQLMEKFNTKLNRKLVLMSQQLGGEIGSAAFKIAGVFDTGSGGFNKSTVYILKSDAQRMLNLDNRIMEVVAILDDMEQSDLVAKELATKLDEKSSAEIFTCRELLPFVVETVKMSGKMMIIVYAIFYVAMAFGILNTLLMSISERTYEFGVLLAIGAKREWVFRLIVLESFFIAAVGTVIGTGVGYAIVDFFGRTGIDLSNFADAMDYVQVGKILYPHVTLRGLAYAAIATFAVAILFSVYPSFRASRMVPVKALRRVGI